jgi:rod shape-determining protein MreD
VLLAAVALLVVQTSGVGGLRPDLLLLFVLAAAMRDGAGAGALWGICLGFAQDTFSAGFPGTGVLTKGFVGVVAGSLRERLDCDNPNTQALLAVGATLADGAAHLAVMKVFSESGGFLEPFLGSVLPAALVGGALLPAAVGALGAIAERLARRAAVPAS